jgi:hypothetical protein
MEFAFAPTTRPRGIVLGHESYSLLDSFLPLDATAQGELWPPEQSASIHLRLIIWFLNNLVFTV